MLNIEKYKSQLKNCRTEKEVLDFIKRYKKQDECVIDWLSRESILDQDNTSEYLKATSIPPVEERVAIAYDDLITIPAYTKEEYERLFN